MKKSVKSASKSKELSNKSVKDRVKSSRKAVEVDEDEEDEVEEDDTDDEEDEDDEEDARAGKKGSAVRGKSKRGKEQRAAKAAESKRDGKIDRKEKAAKAKKSKKAKSSEGLNKKEQGHLIQSIMAKGPVSVNQIAEQTGLSVARVQSHVEYEISKDRAHMDKKGKMVVMDNMPSYRTE